MASVAWLAVLALLLLAFLVVPILELYVFVQVSSAIGFLPTLVWIVGISVVGAWLVRREGLSALRRANQKVARGALPTDELISGVLILLAGALLLTPGFLTDTIGVLLLFPPTRALLRGSVQRRFANGPVLITRSGSGGFTGFGQPPRPPAGERPRRPGDVWDAESWEDPPDPPRLR